MAVNISGSVLASLLYDQVQSDGQQIGFLTGQVVSRMTDTISDSQINNYEVETKIFIYGSVACPRDQRFYNERGEILKDQLHALLKKEAENIVGWYSFRRNSTMRPTLKERMIHENLLRLKNQDSSQFVFLLCTSKASTNISTHSFDHSFSCLQHRSFQRKLVNVINLGDTTHTEYKTLPSHTASNIQGVYSLVVEQQEDNFLDAHGQMEVRQIQSLNGALSKQLEDLSKSVADSETKLSSLEGVVHMYRKQVRLKQLEKEQKLNSVPVPSISVHKKPSVDDILFMDINDGETVLLENGQPHLVPEMTPKIETALPKDMSQSVPKGENSSIKTSVKAEIKLTSPVSVHSRSKSNDHSFTKNSINSQENIHVRSKSADIPDNKHTGTHEKSDTSKDPFSFVSSIIAQSKQEDDTVKSEKEIKTEKLVPSDSSTTRSINDRSTRQRSRNVDGSPETVKKEKNSTQSRSKNNKKTDHQSIDTEKKKEIYDSDNKMATDEGSDSDSGNKSFSKTNLIGSKTCSQEVGKKASDDNQSEESTQDTLDMEVSSSPIY